MSSISDKNIIKIMLANDGVYPGDPQVQAIFSYISMSNEETYKIIYKHRSLEMIFDLVTSPYCRNIKLLWDIKAGLSEEGKKILQG